MKIKDPNVAPPAFQNRVACFTLHSNGLQVQCQSKHKKAKYSKVLTQKCTHNTKTTHENKKNTKPNQPQWSTKPVNRILSHNIYTLLKTPTVCRPPLHRNPFDGRFPSTRRQLGGPGLGCLVLANEPYTLRPGIALVTNKRSPLFKRNKNREDFPLSVSPTPGNLPPPPSSQVVVRASWSTGIRN